jgi:hypothetical protein
MSSPASACDSRYTSTQAAKAGNGYRHQRVCRRPQPRSWPEIDSRGRKMIWPSVFDLVVVAQTWSRLGESNPRPTHYECVALTD